MRNKVERMTLLARVEDAREKRRRAELLIAEQSHAEAAAHAEDAALIHLKACEQREAVLRQRYRTIRGLRSDIDVQGLRSTEQILAVRRDCAEEARRAAEAQAREAFVASERARETLRAVSMRLLRRSQMADMLKQAEKHAALIAEEESASDDLADRFRETETG
jgi:hypothetical protein